MKQKFAIIALAMIGAVSFAGCSKAAPKTDEVNKGKQAGFVAKPGKVEIFNYKTGRTSRVDKIILSREEYSKKFPAYICYVVCARGTEGAFTGKLLSNRKKGIYVCRVCGTDLFTSDAKYNSGEGWPSFFKTVSQVNIIETAEKSGGETRTEASCARCGSHLGHVFKDSKQPTGLRYSINSAAMMFEETK